MGTIGTPAACRRIPLTRVACSRNADSIDAMGFVSPSVALRKENDVPTPEFVTQRDVPELIRERLGIKVALSTIHKKFSPRIGEGPAPVGYWSGRPYYKPDEILEWARGRMTPTRNGAA